MFYSCSSVDVTEMSGGEYKHVSFLVQYAPGMGAGSGGLGEVTSCLSLWQMGFFYSPLREWH